jgi:hypothetical protein
LCAYEAAENTLAGKPTSMFVTFYNEGEGEARCARVEIGNVGHTLSDVLHTWGCCSCGRSTQQHICRHHVLALMHAFPEVGRKEFSNHLLQFGGRRFGAVGFCFPGAGGMKPLSDKLQQEHETHMVIMKQFKSCQHTTPPTVSEATKPAMSTAQLIPSQYIQQQPSSQVHHSVTLASSQTCIGALAPHALSIEQSHMPAACSVPAVTKLTPSKRCADEGAQSLKNVLNRGIHLMIDPTCPSPERRKLHTIFSQAASAVQNMCTNHMNGIYSGPMCSEQFQSRAHHVYNPNSSPARMKSAAESSRPKPRLGLRPAVPLETLLELGKGDDMQPSDFQKAQDARKKPHGFSERSEHWAARQKKACEEDVVE